MTSAHAAPDVRIFHKECVSLAMAGYEVHLVAAGTLPEEEDRVVHHSLNLNERWGRLGRMVLGSWKTYSLAKATQAQIVHFHDPELLPYGLLLKWQGRRVFYDAHEDLGRDVLMKAWIPRAFRKPIAAFVERLEHWVARRLDAVVAATPFIAQRFQGVGAVAVVVKNYPRLGELAQSNSKATRPSICYIGLISLERGIVEMLQAIEDLDVTLILAGAFNNQQTEEKARSQPGWSKVDYRGLLSRAEIATLCGQAQLGLCLLHPTPTYSQALPIKLFEYMSAGMPVLCSNIPLWMDIVQKAECGLCVDPKDTAAIHKAIRWFLSHADAAKTMGNKGREAVVEHYNWEKESEALLALYRTTCSKQ
jgi:glycosyltransferase involved in cell wall biosynthesis